MARSPPHSSTLTPKRCPGSCGSEARGFSSVQEGIRDGVGAAEFSRSETGQPGGVGVPIPASRFCDLGLGIFVGTPADFRRFFAQAEKPQIPALAHLVKPLFSPQESPNSFRFLSLHALYPQISSPQNILFARYSLLDSPFVRPAGGRGLPPSPKP